MAIPELDVAFVCDCTGSMGSYIRTAQQNITSIAEKLTATEKRDLRFALICYRDHPPQDSSYATRVFEFTSSVSKMKQNVDTMAADGGGDGPESVACALDEISKLPFRKEAVKLAIVISDAPPHGIGAGGDGFPDGCPCGVDPLETAHRLKDMGVVIYSVGCEPAIGSMPGSREFFKGIADITGGRYLSLVNAKLLPDIIIGGAAEEAALQAIAAEVEAEVQRQREEAPDASDEIVYSRAAAKLSHIETPQLALSDQVEVDALFVKKSKSLAACRAEFSKCASAPPTAGYGGGSPGARMMASMAAPMIVAPKKKSASFFGRVKNVFSLGGEEAAAAAAAEEEEEEVVQQVVCDDASEGGYVPPAAMAASRMMAEDAAGGAPMAPAVQNCVVEKSSISIEQVMRLSNRK
jgi:Mg-chelatase subunit ChlD